MVHTTETHEDFNRTDKVQTSSDRAFGLVFAVVFLIMGTIPMFQGEPFRWWAEICSVLFATIALLSPEMLAPLNRQWIRLGQLLHRIVSPIILAAIFLVGFVPLGWAMRLMRKRPLDVSPDSEITSYWKNRDPFGPTPDSMNRQF